MARYLYKNRRSLIGYMDIHAYSQLWMTPWGYKKTLPKDYTELVSRSYVVLQNVFKILKSEQLILQCQFKRKDSTSWFAFSIKPRICSFVHVVSFGTDGWLEMYSTRVEHGIVLLVKA